MANKAELVEKVAAKTNLTKKDVTATVEALFETIQRNFIKRRKSSSNRLRYFRST